MIELTDRYSQTKIRIRPNEIASYLGGFSENYVEIALKNGMKFHVLDCIQLIDKKVNEAELDAFEQLAMYKSKYGAI